MEPVRYPAKLRPLQRAPAVTYHRYCRCTEGGGAPVTRGPPDLKFFSLLGRSAPRRRPLKYRKAGGAPLLVCMYFSAFRIRFFGLSNFQPWPRTRSGGRASLLIAD